MNVINIKKTIKFNQQEQKQNKKQHVIDVTHVNVNLAQVGTEKTSKFSKSTFD